MIKAIEQEPTMTALISLAMLFVVVASGAMYVEAIDEIAGSTASGLLPR